MEKLEQILRSHEELLHTPLTSQNAHDNVGRRRNSNISLPSDQKTPTEAAPYFCPSDTTWTPQAEALSFLQKPFNVTRNWQTSIKQATPPTPGMRNSFQSQIQMSAMSWQPQMPQIPGLQPIAAIQESWPSISTPQAQLWKADEEFGGCEGLNHSALKTDEWYCVDLEMANKAVKEF